MERNFVFLYDHDGYHHRCHNKTKLLTHLIFVTKYRKPLLSGDIAADIKQLIFETAKVNHWYIKKMETDIDHIHILLQYPPNDSIRHIVSVLKQASTYKIWKMHACLLSTQYWREHTFWSDGYFTASTGDVSTAIIEEYIAGQG